MDIQTGSSFAGYAILRELGTGGMGSVYLVHNPRLDRQEAMKLLHAQFCSDPIFVERFNREAKLACRLDHPSVLPVYDRGSADGRLWLTMRYVNGMDVDQLLRERGPMHPARAVRLIGEIADALDYAHRAGLVHRDVKPANILLAQTDTGGDRAYLTDFGIAHLTEASVQLTDTGDLLGSLPYAAPEQLEGRPVTGAADVYALGCVLYELVTGRRLFNQPIPAAVMAAVLNGPTPDALDALPVHGLRAVVLKALAQRPEDRYPTCKALAEAARAAVPWTAETVVPAPGGSHDRAETPPLPPLPPGPVDRPPRARPRRRLLWAAAALVVVLGLSGVGVWLIRSSGPDAPTSVDAGVTADGVELRWRAVEGADEYEVYRDGEFVGTSATPDYVDTEVPSGARVAYAVAAVDGGDQSDRSDPRTVVAPLHPVSNLTPEVDGDTVNLTWTPVENADRYEVRREDQVLQSQLASAAFSDEGLQPGRYTYTVEAFDAEGAPSSSGTVEAEISPWLAAADLVAAFPNLIPPQPGPGGWDGATCRTLPPVNDPADALIRCDHASGIFSEFAQYPDQTALDARMTRINEIADPAVADLPEGGWYRQSPPGNDPAWEAWGFVSADRRLMTIYIEWSGHTVADLDAAWFNVAPWRG